MIERLHIVVFLILVFVIILVYIRTQHKEKIALIKSGDFALDLHYLRNRRISALSRGILYLSMGIGFLTAYLVTKNNEANAFPVFVIAITISGGIGLLVVYFILKYLDKKNDI